MEHLQHADYIRFWSQVDIGLAEQCWPFKCFVNRDGYGKFATRFQGKQKNVAAHRVAYRFCNGPLVPGMVIRHICNNPVCCNPSPLVQGTHEENMNDMWQAGRGNRMLGEKAPKARLTAGDVCEIVRLIRGGEQQKAVAARYGVSRSTVARICEGSNWQHVTSQLGISPRQRGKYPLYPEVPSDAPKVPSGR